jgi:hypothetical protein
MILELVTAVSLAVGAGALGLWVGERGRRIAAEKREVYGTPIATPTKGRTLPPATDPEHRAMTAGFSEETIERGIASIMAEARRQGRPMDPLEARNVVEAMLYSGQASGFEMGGPL